MSRIGDWVLDERLATGGQGEVWRAHNVRPRQSVALKLVRPATPAARSRAAREIALLQELHHPHLVEILDHGEDGAVVFYVMALAERGSLRDILRERPLTSDEALTVLAAIADALAAVHRLGIVHRDVKPSNVLVDRDGRPRLSDFGVALRPEDERLTLTGDVVGSAGYLAPELRRGDDASSASDAWALGVLAYRCVCREHPPTGLDGAVDRVAVRRRLEEAGAAALATPVTELLAPQPADRPPLEVVAQEVRALLPAPVPIEAPVRPIDAPRRSHGRRAAAVGVVAVAIALAVAIAVFAAVGGDDDNGRVDAPPPRPGVRGQLVLGELLSRTGPYEGTDAAFDPAIRAALHDVNDAGGVNGHRVALVPIDDKSTPIDGRLAMRTAMAKDHVDAFVGPGTSSLAEQLVGDVAIERTLTCSGSTTSSDIDGLGDRDAFFRTVPVDGLQAEALAQLVIARRPQRVAILKRSGPTFAHVARVVRDRLRAAGVPIVATPAEYDRKSPDFATEAQAVADARPDAIVLVATDEAPRVVRALIDAGVGPDQVPVFTTDDAQRNDFAKVAGVPPSAIVGVQGTVPAPVARGSLPAFVREPLAQGHDAVLAAYYYDCVVLEALAAESIGSDDPVRMRRAMHEVASGGTSCSTYARCKRLLARHENIDYDGITGEVDLDRSGSPSIAYFAVWRYDANGAIARTAGPLLRVTASS